MKRVIACVVARATSTRLPLKAFRTVVDDKSMLDFIIERLKLVKGISEIYLCTSDDPVDEIMEDVAQKNKVKIFRGSAEDVISRIVTVGDQEEADYVIRITGDNVFTSYEYIDQQISFMEEENLDYVRLVGVPIGATAEVIKLTALKDCQQKMDPQVSEYLMLFIFNPDVYKCGILKVLNKDYSEFSLTVDSPNDLTRTRYILTESGENPLHIRLKDIVAMHEEKEIPYFALGSTAPVKLPYGKVVSYSDFMADLKSRVEKSAQRIISL